MRSNYEEVCSIGDGGFGVVTKMRNIATGQIVAMKRMKQKTQSFAECLELKEVKSLRKIKHENVVKLVEVFREKSDGTLYLAFEHCDGNLYKLISTRKSPIPEPVIRNILFQLLSGVDAIHKAGFFHRDLKPENVLFVGDTLKIIDFGLAREIRSKPPYTNYVGTRYYRAPEILLHHDFYNTPVDIWALGCIMAELYLQKPLFPGTSETDEIYKICAVLGPPTEQNFPEGYKLAQKLGIRFQNTTGTGLNSLLPDISAEGLDLLKKMLTLDPHKRPSAKQALNHPFFQGKQRTISQMDIETPRSPLQSPHTNATPQKELPHSGHAVRNSGNFSRLDYSKKAIDQLQPSRPIDYDQFQQEEDDIFDGI
ncbi:CMGC family protein kinase [Trichomonas vaginalis G3]|uniref:CMGC family protein kinase n=1 Tax=Trichomonas vaginalis (strain ATCC PRA-98 / G3) TaxID=412133 RepID=A2DI39_TRIV3|nr:STKc MAK like domain-containing protein [Trichomonas vaginalis G3]EAY19835.1 CMGC family protein kinase [Trichomonas vaginalis G3]KAI5510037.1 STKc MAK like domain-containing protein [Trichomonas vaginalis G3]|eukprot:XP_001580821.1 CMGC family protein kinase [Trichomonas vaginalis G3]